MPGQRREKGHNYTAPDPLDEGLAANKLNENELLVFTVDESTKSRFVGKIRYWWSFTVAGALLLFIATPALLFLGLIRRREWLYPLALWGAKAWLRASGVTAKVTGAENLEPDRSYVFASNHRSYLDTAALFRYAGRRMGIVAKKELLRVPVMGQGMGFVNIIAIDRSNAERALRSMEKARKVMERGYSFGVFIEGTRALPGQLLPFKKGAFHLALQTGSAIVPVAIRNSDVLMGKRTGVAYAGEIEMVLGQPIETAGLTANDIPHLINQTRTFIANELSEQ